MEITLAVYNNNEDAAKFLLKSGAKPDAHDLSGNTAMMRACFKGYLNMVMLLHQYKADLNTLNFNGASSFIFASTFGHSDIVKYLLAQKADKSIKDKWGKTALGYAVNQENDGVVALLK